MAVEPVDREITHTLKRTRLLKEMCRAGDNRQFIGTSQLGLGIPVELEHLVVGPPHDQQCRRAHRTEAPPQVWAPAAGDDGAHLLAEISGRGQGGSRPVLAPK